MRILLDECLPRGLKSHLPGHEVQTVPEAGWTGKKNGQLILLAAGKVDVFITVDKNIVYQQNLKDLSFGVVVLVAKSNRLGDLLALVPEILTAVQSLKPGQVVKVGS